MSEAGSDSQLSAETVSGTPQSGAVLERGLPISGKSVPASSGKLADDVSPWDGQVYARVAAGTPADITRAADADLDPWCLLDGPAHPSRRGRRAHE